MMQLPVYPISTSFSIEREIGSAEFACDLSVCKGACCTMPAERGAPILFAEIAELERVYPLVEKYLPESALQVITDVGIWKREDDGEFTIPTVHGRECIFVHWDGDVAKCAIQTAHRNKEIEDFEKPISCHLFPIRIYPEADDNSYFICYEEISECEGGRKNGKATHSNLLEYLRGPLSRAIGAERTEQLIQRYRQ